LLVVDGGTFAGVVVGASAFFMDCAAAFAEGIKIGGDTGAQSPVLAISRQINPKM